eukprot:SAG11_NODE_3966_length_2129_cov_4.699015_3_plen_56_part_00
MAHEAVDSEPVLSHTCCSQAAMAAGLLSVLLLLPHNGKQASLIVDDLLHGSLREL